MNNIITTNNNKKNVSINNPSPAGLRRWGVLAFYTSDGYRLKYAPCSVNSLRCQIIVRRLKGGIA